MTFPQKLACNICSCQYNRQKHDNCIQINWGLSENIGWCTSSVKHRELIRSKSKTGGSTRNQTNWKHNLVFWVNTALDVHNLIDWHYMTSRYSKPSLGSAERAWLSLEIRGQDNMVKITLAKTRFTARSIWISPFSFLVRTGFGASLYWSPAS